MLTVLRSSENPVLLPESQNPWEELAAFNGSPLKAGRTVHLLYRALAHPELHHGSVFPMSTIGHAKSPDGIHFGEHRQFIFPEEEWERYGCEDPRITKLGDKFYIFYTALSTYPFSPSGITVGLAISEDLKKIKAKHHITHFNSKAMTLFPEKINGQIAALLSANTDQPPSSIALALFDKEEDLWSRDYWEKWYQALPEHALNLHKRAEDHVEIGASPIKTKKGWLLIYSHIYYYATPKQIFAIEAVLLDINDPKIILGRTASPLMVPSEEYELYGMIPNIVFPSGAYAEKDDLHIFYGAADTTVCRATISLSKLLQDMLLPQSALRFERSPDNPILLPVPEHPWESKAVFNPAALHEDEKIHLIYRAMGEDDTSRFGYAVSRDGIRIDERLSQPIYQPREDFEMKTHPGNSGCEDARLTRLGDTYHMCYTAFDGTNPPRVALSSISVKDFLARRFEKFSRPILISPPGIDNKDAAIFPEKIDDQYVIIHRIQPSVHLNYVKSLDFFDGDNFLTSNPILAPRLGMWDDAKVGLSSTPIKTKKGWLLIYHGVSSTESVYRVGAALLDIKHPEKVIGRTATPLFEPVMEYEKIGVVPNVVFPCGSLVIGEKLYIYYGGADQVIGVAWLELSQLLAELAS